jgi:hypothetical protein
VTGRVCSLMDRDSAHSHCQGRGSLAIFHPPKGSMGITDVEPTALIETRPSDCVGAAISGT